MVKLDASVLKHMSADDFRVLTAIEMGMKNHDLVPTTLIASLSNLKFGGCHKAIVNLHKHKLIYHESKPYDGYRLTYAGYDYLVLKTMVKRGSVTGIGRQIGVGKESDIYIVINDNEEEMAFKFHRLGRTSFRSVKRNRDYHQHRKSASWLYLSRLAALKEHSYMAALFAAGFPVPRPVDLNRHGIAMQLIHAYPLAHVNSVRHPEKVYAELMALIVKLAQYGVIHGDFNEFNLMIDDHEHLTLIDFPQMVSVDHVNAEYYFDRDVNCIRALFERRYGYVADWWPTLKSAATQRTHTLDKEVAASGFTRELQSTFEELLKEQEEVAKVEGDEVEEEDEEDVGDAIEEVPLTASNTKKDKPSKGKEAESKSPIEINADSKNKIELTMEEVGESAEDSEPETTVADEAALEDNANKAGEKVSVRETPISLEQIPSALEGTHVDDKRKELDEAAQREADIARRQHIQKRVRQKLAQAERRKRGNKNAVKNRDKRALNAEAKAQGDFW